MVTAMVGALVGPSLLLAPQLAPRQHAATSSLLHHEPPVKRAVSYERTLGAALQPHPHPHPHPQSHPQPQACSRTSSRACSRASLTTPSAFLAPGLEDLKARAAGDSWRGEAPPQGGRGAGGRAGGSAAVAVVAVAVGSAPMKRPLARDTVVTFGKHKGLMLGTVPRRYLQWIVDKGIQADMGFPILAQQVLEDPVYKDRVEWDEIMRKVDQGGITIGCGAEWELHCKRYCWDPRTEAWGGVTFDSIGTSFSKRVPRVDPTLPLSKQPLRPPKKRAARPLAVKKDERSGEWVTDLALDAPGKEGAENRRRLRRERMLIRRKESRGAAAGKAGDGGSEDDEDEDEESEVVAELEARFPGRQVYVQRTFDQK